MAEFTDWLGQPIEVGSPVLYAVSNSHYAEVVWGEVLEIIPVAPQVREDRNDPTDQDLPWHQRRVTGTFDYWPYGRKFKLKIQPHYQNSDFRDDSIDYASGIRGVKYEHHYSEGDWEDPDPEKRPKSLSVDVVREPIKPVFVQNVEKVTVFALPDGARERLEAEIERRIALSKERFAKQW